MLSLELRIRKSIDDHRLISADQSVVIGVSGGPDSICLMHLLCSLDKNLQLTCVYVDHNLRPDESVRESKLVESQCRRLKVDFVTVSVDVPAEVSATGESIEACGRRLRYAALEKVRRSRQADIIAVGHTADDQVEEVLLRLIRGSGLKGLSGMRPKNGRVIRPLLEVSRQEILAYLGSNEHEFCHDSSNESDRFLRNRIRMELLPLLEKRFNPSIRNTLLNTAKILEIEDDLLTIESDRLFGSIVEISESDDSGGQRNLTISAERLAGCHTALRRRILERACWETGCRPDFKKIGKIEALLDSAGSGPELHLQNGVRVLRQHDSLLFTTLAADQHPRDRLAQATVLRQDIPGPGTYLVAELDRRLEIELTNDKVFDDQTMRVDADSVDFPLRLRSVLAGDRFTPLGAPGRKKIARFLSDRKVPKHLRAQHPVLESDQGIVCVLGLEIDERCRSTETTSCWLMIRWERG